MQTDDPSPKTPQDVGLTAYAGDEATLRTRLATGSVERESFRRPISRCDIATCRGMCCYDGVYVSAESAAVIQGVVQEHADFFKSLGLELPPQVIVQGGWQGRSDGLKTAVRPRPFSAMVEGYPTHFEDMACVFLADDGRCSLQALSVHLGLHPWYYKPIKCWLHPITVEGQGKDVLMLHNRETDPYRLPQYDGFVSAIFCGRTCPGGAPASQVLSEELAFLSRIVGRDLLAELSGLANGEGAGSR